MRDSQLRDGRAPEPVRAPAGAAPARGRWGDLGPRAVSGAVLGIAAVVTTRVGGGVFALTWLAAAIGVNWEWQRLIGGARRRSRTAAGAVALVAVAALTTLPILAAPPPAWALVPARSASAAILVLACGLAALLAGAGARAWAAAGVLYAGLLLLAVLALRFSTPLGTRSIVWLFATVWSTDVFAYGGGRLIGGPKLWPRVSPSKTWSGTVSGIAAGTLAGSFVAMHDLPIPSSPAAIMVVTLAAATLSQAGDAFESSVKRRFGVKDSSRLIPGHGGIMDRLDGFIAAAVFAFATGLAHHMPSTAGGLFSWA